MKGCIVLQNQYAKLGHALAVNLKENHNVNEWCTYIFSPGAKKFISEQKEINYSSVLVDHDLHAQFSSTQLDEQYIKSFEKKYSPHNIWQYLYADRKLMMSMGPKEESTAVIDPMYSHEDLLRAFQVRAQAIEKMLTIEKPDFIIFFAIGALAHLILYQVAKKMGIRTFNIDFPRIGNSIAITEDYRTLTGVDELFQSFQKNRGEEKYKQEAERFIEQYKKTGSLQLEYFETFMKNFQKPKRMLAPKNLFKSIKYFFTLTNNYHKNKEKFTYGMTDLHPGKFYLYKMKERYRGWRGLQDLYSKPKEGEDFAFFPLHFEPELALLLLSPFYFDQLALIRCIARSLPVHFKLYVKEHPAMKNKRPRSYYEELVKIPNVRLIDPKVKSFELIKKTKLVTTITGTVGWEASLLGKPVITFGEVFYNSLSFVKRVHDIERLPELMQEQLNNFAYDPEEMKNFLAAAFQDAIHFNFFNLWYENDMNTLIHDKGVKLFGDSLMKKYENDHSHSDV